MRIQTCFGLVVILLAATMVLSGCSNGASGKLSEEQREEKRRQFLADSDVWRFLPGRLEPLGLAWPAKAEPPFWPEGVWADQALIGGEGTLDALILLAGLESSLGTYDMTEVSAQTHRVRMLWIWDANKSALGLILAESEASTETVLAVFGSKTGVKLVPKDAAALNQLWSRNWTGTVVSFHRSGSFEPKAGNGEDGPK